MANGWVTVTAAKTMDSSGNLVSGTIVWTPVDQHGNPMSFRAPGPGYGQVIDSPITAQVTNGAFSISVPDSALCSPLYVGFAVTLLDEVTNENLLGNGYSCVQASSTSTDANLWPNAQQWCTSSGTASFDAYPLFLPALPVAALPGGGGNPQGIGPAGSQGSPGQPGQSATVAVGTTTTLAAGASATVTNTGSASAAVLAFGIPQGPQGIPGTAGTNGSNGASATVAVGTVATGAAGSSAAVTNSGTSLAAVLNFAIPQGQPGTNGTNGSNGAPGAAATIAIGTVTAGTPGLPGSVTNVGTASAQVWNIVLPVVAFAIGDTVTLPAGSANTVSFSPGSDSLHQILNFGIAVGTGTATTGGGVTTTPTTGLTLIDSSGADYQVFCSNNVLSETQTTAGSSAATPVASVTLIDSMSGNYVLVTSVNGVITSASTSSGTGAVASIILPDTVTGGTRTLTSANGVLTTV